jgi:hypothetical protein
MCRDRSCSDRSVTGRRNATEALQACRYAKLRAWQEPQLREDDESSSAIQGATRCTKRVPCRAREATRGTTEDSVTVGKAGSASLAEGINARGGTQMKRYLSTVCVCLGLCAFGAAVPFANAGVYGRQLRNASYVFHDEIELVAGVTYTIRTENLSAGSDTVLYLWDETAAQQVAMNDDYGGLMSQVTVTPTHSGTYRIVVRAYRAWTSGVCDIVVESIYGQETYSAKMFGGDTFSVDFYSSLVPGDTIQTALAPGGTKDTFLWTFDASGNLVGFDDDLGVGKASKVTVNTQVKWITAATFVNQNGAAFVITNDAAGDSDGDGLGPQLEAAICTCDSSSTPQDISCKYPSCSLGGVADTRDSDGDGIRDDYELLGRARIGPEWRDFHQHLPAWGANPARMDIFVEVDFADDDQTPPNNGWADDFALLTDAAVSDRIDRVIAPYLDAHATQYLKNRDSSTTIARNRPAEDVLQAVG